MVGGLLRRHIVIRVIVRGYQIALGIDSWVGQSGPQVGSK